MRPHNNRGGNCRAKVFSVLSEHTHLLTSPGQKSHKAGLLSVSHSADTTMMEAGRAFSASHCEFSFLKCLLKDRCPNLACWGTGWDSKSSSIMANGDCHHLESPWKQTSKHLSKEFLDWVDRGGKPAPRVGYPLSRGGWGHHSTSKGLQ